MGHFLNFVREHEWIQMTTISRVSKKYKVRFAGHLEIETRNVGNAQGNPRLPGVNPTPETS